MDQIASDHYYQDIERASKDKNLQKDLTAIFKKYYVYDSKRDYDYGDHDGAWRDKDKLAKKYPQYKDILESFGFYEDPRDGVNWFEDNIDPDYWSDNYKKKAEQEVKTITAMAKAEWNNKLANKYGQDAVDQILKKGYTSLV